MSNTPSDVEIWELIPDEWTMTVQHAPGAKALVLCNVEDFARAVLAKWGTPQPVVREPLHAVDLMRIVLKIEQEHHFLRGTSNWAMSVGRAIERAHGITQKGGCNVPNT